MRDAARAGNLFFQKLMPDDVEKIKHLLNQGCSHHWIAKRFSVSPKQVHAIKRGESWGWLSGTGSIFTENTSFLRSAASFLIYMRVEMRPIGATL